MLQLNNITAGYGKIVALTDVSLHVDDGEIVTIIGANGAGKSTMLKMISGLVTPTAGEIIYCGEKLPNSVGKITAAGITHVPEGRCVFPSLSVKDNLIMGGYLRPWKEINESMDDVFQLFPRLKERIKQPAGTLSGGEQQMLAIGRGVMSHPKLMMFDEPSLGLAPMVVQEIFEFFPKVNKERGITMIVIEQNAKMAFKVADRAYVLENGKIVREGKSDELMHDESIIKAYLGG